MDIIYNLILYSPCFISLSWAILLFCNRKRNIRSQNIWMVAMMVMSVSTFVWIMLFGQVIDYSLYYKLDVLDVTFTLLFLPLVYLYFRTLTDKRKFTWKQYVWLLPGIISGSITGFLYLLMGEEQSVDYIQKVIMNQDTFQFMPGSLQWMLYIISVYLFSIIFFIQTVVVMSYSTLNVIRYKKGLHNFFSNLDEKALKNNQAVLTGLFILLITSLTATLLWGVSPEKYYSLKYVLMVITGACLYYMSYHVYKIKPAADVLLFEELQEPEKDSFTHETYMKMLPLFNKLIDEDRIFLQPNLSLDDIATQLNSNRTYISRIINENFQCTFYEFINRKRIEFAKTLIAQDPNLTQEQITEKSGFIYTSSFSRTFKRQTGITFREWQKRRLN